MPRPFSCSEISKLSEILYNLYNKSNQQTSSLHVLSGGSQQGSILGQLLYINGSDGAVEDDEEDKKY